VGSATCVHRECCSKRCADRGTQRIGITPKARYAIAIEFEVLGQILLLLGGELERVDFASFVSTRWLAADPPER
jgi:hypothetical protein